MKDSTFNAKTDQPITPEVATETPLYKASALGGVVGNPDAYNCHSYAWHESKGDDEFDCSNENLRKMGITKWDNDPADDIAEQGYCQLESHQDNEVGDRVIYYVDSDENGRYDSGEQIEHSAIVTEVDNCGYTTMVRGKMGQSTMSSNHPNAPGYYDAANVGTKRNPVEVRTSRAYFRKEE